MSLPDALTLTLVVLVSAWIGRRGRPVARLMLWGSAVLVSAAMFLSSTAIVALLGPDVLAVLPRIDHALPWSSSTVAHFIAFAWLALVVWTLRPDLRGWRAPLLMAMLGLGSEALQGLVDGRSSNWHDVRVNLAASAAGLLIGAVGTWVAAAFRRFSGTGLVGTLPVMAERMPDTKGGDP